MADFLAHDPAPLDATLGLVRAQQFLATTPGTLGAVLGGRRAPRITCTAWTPGGTTERYYRHTALRTADGVRVWWTSVGTADPTGAGAPAPVVLATITVLYQWVV